MATKLLVDTHLVMNALNQVAAMQMAGPDPEHPLVFILSDYLREALSTLESQRLTLQQEIQLLSAHLALQACVLNTEAALTGSTAQASAQIVARAALSECVISLFKAIGPRASRQWRVTLSATPPGSGEAGWMPCTITIASDTPVPSPDLALLAGTIGALDCVQRNEARVTEGPAQVTTGNGGTNVKLLLAVQ